MMDKTKTLQKLLQAHDALYNGREIIEDTSATGALADRLGAALDSLDQAEALIDAIVGDPFWKRIEKEM